MKANANPIVLKSNRISDECIGTVRLTPEAEKVIRRLRAKTALPIRQIVSEIIVQAENLLKSGRQGHAVPWQRRRTGRG